MPHTEEDLTELNYLAQKYSRQGGTIGFLKYLIFKNAEYHIRIFDNPVFNFLGYTKRLLRRYSKK